MAGTTCETKGTDTMRNALGKTIGAALRGVVVCILSMVLGFAASDVRADQTRQEVFDLGYDVGRPCAQGIGDNAALASDARILSEVRRGLSGAVAAANNLGLSSQSLGALLREAPSLTRAQYLGLGSFAPGRSRVVMDELQQGCRQKYGEEAATLFTQGVWMGGAQCTARAGEGFDRRERPGTYALVERNVSWMEGNAAAVGCSKDAISRLRQQMATRPGPAFGEIRARLEDIARAWRDELRKQPPFGAAPVVQLTNENWVAEVVRSEVPVLVLFMTPSSPPAMKQLKFLEEYAGHYDAGTVKFGRAEPKTCGKVFQQERIIAIPEIRLYRNGHSAGKLESLNDKAALDRLLQSGPSSGGGLLGIEMGGVVQ